MAEVEMETSTEETPEKENGEEEPEDKNGEEDGQEESKAEFRERADKIYEIFKGDPEKKDVALAEMYVFMQEIDANFRKIVDLIENSGGPLGLMRNIFGGKKKDV